MKAIVLVIDRLGTGYLGPYGNTWIDTPALNRLASRAAVLDNTITDSTRLSVVYRSYWTGLHALSPETTVPPSIPARLTDLAIPCSLITDEREVARHRLAADFSQQITMPERPLEQIAEDVTDSCCAELFAAVVQWFDTAPTSFLLWIHARGMQGPWDAPEWMRHQFADEGEPVPSDFVAPPALDLVEDFDPDELLPLAHAYAGQVSLIDTCLTALLESLEESGRLDDTLLMLTSPRGYPLGEHGRVGDSEGLLHAEALNVPWLIRTPHQRHALRRLHEFAQPCDLAPTLAEWFELGEDQPSGWGRGLGPLLDERTTTVARDRAVSIGGESVALRTAAWSWIRRRDGRQSLYAKPDDRWEANEISDRRQDVVERMAAEFESTRAAIEAGDRDLEPLPESLAEV